MGPQRVLHLATARVDLYTLGAFFLALVATGFFVWLRFQFGLSPLERYYLPYYLRSETAGLMHPESQLPDALSSPTANRRAASPLKPMCSQVPRRSSEASLCRSCSLPRQPQHGTLLPRTRGAAQLSRTKRFTHGLRTRFTATFRSMDLFKMQLLFGLAAFLLQLPFSIRKDIARIRMLRYGRRLKGPVLVNATEFTKAVAGNGIGITTNDFKLPLRIPRDAENKHFLIVGDTGTGKSSIIRQLLYQVDARGDAAIVYDPACEFVKQFYDPAPRRHCPQSAGRPDALLEPVEGVAPQGRGQGAGRLALSAGRRDEPILRRGSAEDFRSLVELSADAGRPRPMDVRPGRNRPARAQGPNIGRSSIRRLRSSGPESLARSI